MPAHAGALSGSALLRHFFDYECRDILSIGSMPKARVKPYLCRQLVRDARAARNADKTAALASPQQFHKFREIVDVRIFLRDYLRDEDGVRAVRFGIR